MSHRDSSVLALEHPLKIIIFLNDEYQKSLAIKSKKQSLKVSFGCLFPVYLQPFFALVLHKLIKNSDQIPLTSITNFFF